MSVRSFRDFLKRTPSNTVINEPVTNRHDEEDRREPNLGGNLNPSPNSNSTSVHSSDILTNVHTPTVHTDKAKTTNTNANGNDVPEAADSGPSNSKSPETASLVGNKRYRETSTSAARSTRQRVVGAQTKLTSFVYGPIPNNATRTRRPSTRRASEAPPVRDTPSTTNHEITNPRSNTTATEKRPEPAVLRQRPSDKAYEDLKKYNLEPTKRISNKMEMMALFKTVSHRCESVETCTANDMKGVAEVIKALGMIAVDLMERAQEDEMVAGIREASREIFNSTKDRLVKVAEEVVTNAKRTMGRVERVIDTCADTLKVAANDTAAAAETQTRSYAQAAGRKPLGPSQARGARGGSPAGSSQAGKYWERDSKRLILDPPRGSSLLKEGEKTQDLLDRITAAMRKAGGKDEWEIAAGGRLEKGGFLVEANSREARAWFDTTANVANFIKEFGPVQIRSKAYKIKGLKIALSTEINEDDQGGAQNPNNDRGSIFYLRREGLNHTNHV
ncbi:hypothetical protein ONZ45_g4576 [Pleurotus djamor]|nr:hypothetical protein ONZ45_g4576 [Pleurotus djamor]